MKVYEVTTTDWEIVAPQRYRKLYKGVEVVKTWNPSNFHGSLSHIVNVDGKAFSSPSWENLKKRINKYLKEGR